MYAHKLLQGTCQRVIVMRLAPQRRANVYHRFGGFYHTVLFVSDDHSHPIHMTDRIWNVENKRKQKTVIVVKSKERGARTKVTACSYSPDGRYVAGGKSHCHGTHTICQKLV